MSQVCPDCKGNGRVFSMIHGRNADGSAFHDSGYRDCRTCNGAKVISDEYAERLATAETRRQERVGRGVSLNEEAKHLGMTPQELSHLEHPKP